jgi:hypothetical protein
MTQTNSGTGTSAASTAGESPKVVTVGGIKWGSALEFTQLFRGFRMATNPAKLMVALVAIVVIYFAGRAFDAVWGPQVGAGEIDNYQTLTPEAFAEGKQKYMDGRPDVIGEMVRNSAPADKQLSTDDVKAYGQSPRSAYRYVKGSLIDAFHKRVDKIRDERTELEKTRAERDKNPPKDLDRRSEKTPSEIEQETRRDAAARLNAAVRNAQEQMGQGVFESLMDYELRQFDNLIQCGVSPSRLAPPTSGEKGAVWKSDTAIGCIANMAVTGPKWFFTASGPLGYRGDGFFSTVFSRGLYILSLVLYGLVFLVTAAFSGAVICRLTALEFAGVDRPPLAEVFGFARRKFFTFLAAPLTPFVILLVAGLALSAVSLVGAIPVIGEILAGLLFFISLAVGFVLMLILMGILAGYNLIFPTIAAEGTDTFDAMSRSFAYVYARPWRLAFYTAIMLMYGTITILFVSFAVYLILTLTHFFAGLGINFFGAAYGSYSGQSKLDTLWPSPEFGHLAAPVNWWAMSWSEYIGAIFMHFWVFLLIGVIGAYVVSFYYSSHTILYFLLRRSVEGQSLTDVYKEELPPAPPSPPAVPAAAEAVTPAVDAAAPPPISAVASAAPPAVPPVPPEAG